MKNFLIRLSIFISIPLVYFGINFSINLNRILEYKIPSSDKNVIIGDSQIDYGIIPYDIESTFSMSQPAEPFYHSFWKLKRLSKDNKNIKNVLFGCSHHNFSELNELRTCDKRWSFRLFKNSYTIEDFSDLKELDVDYNQYYKVILEFMCLKPIKRHWMYFDEFNVDHSVLKPNLDYVIKNHFYDKNGEQYGVSETSQRYFDSIVNFCEKNNYRLMPLSTPVHADYMKKIPEEFILHFEKVKLSLWEKGIKFYDYTELNFNDSSFLDYNHLNFKGGKVFTRKMDSILNTIN